LSHHDEGHPGARGSQTPVDSRLEAVDDLRQPRESLRGQLERVGPWRLDEEALAETRPLTNWPRGALEASDPRAVRADPREA